VSGARPSSRFAEYKHALRAGIRADQLDGLAGALGVDKDAGELAIARALLGSLVHDQMTALRVGAAAVEPGPDAEQDSPIIAGRASFLMRLTSGGEPGSMDLERIDDLRTLIAVVLAGKLTQRRAAVLRLGDLLQAGKAGSAEQARSALEALAHLRAFPIAYEVWQVSSRLPGAEGRRARQEGERWDELVAQLETQVRAFWDGEPGDEPTAGLPDEQRVQLLVRTRDLSDECVHHLSAVIEGCDGVSDQRSRAALLSALLNAGDRRLVPALRAALESGKMELFVPATRALGRIDDPRVQPILRTAYERTAAAEERLVLAGALGSAGDRRALPYVREALASGDERLLAHALEALAEVGDVDDVQAVTELLEHQNPRFAIAAVRTLGRIGESRALLGLRELSSTAETSALRAEIEEAQEAIVARMELLGEEAATPRTFDTTKRAAMVRRKDPALVQLRARWYFLLGYFWLALRAQTRALERFEAAAALQPDWAAPVLAVAMAYARKQESPQALGGFRRALGIDHVAVENNAHAMRMLAHAFLRRADAMQREGREDIARGLLEEALSIDLRKAPSDLRFALEQRLHVLRTKFDSLRPRPNHRPGAAPLAAVRESPRGSRDTETPR
jgi:tetratricopeptide (TPR) repeat protein